MTTSRKSYSRRQSQYSPIHNQKNYSYHTLGDHVEEQEEFQSFSKRDLATLLSTAEGNFKDQKKQTLKAKENGNKERILLEGYQEQIVD